MSPSNYELLEHILDEINFVLDSTAGKDYESTVNDPILSRAIIRSLEIIGEASNKIDPDFKAANPHVEWRKITNTRHRLIHDYFGVDYEIVWTIITEELPGLKDDISALMGELNS